MPPATGPAAPKRSSARQRRRPAKPCGSGARSRSTRWSPRSADSSTSTCATATMLRRTARARTPTATSSSRLSRPDVSRETAAADLATKMSVAERLAELASRYDLDEAAVRALAGLLEAVGDDPEAPTTIRTPAEAVDAHLADSLVALELPAVAAAREIADLGSGPGFPGMALAAALPGARVRLVESAARKSGFLERTRARAGIPNTEVVHARAEAW